MSTDYFREQYKLIDKHLAKAEQCREYGRYDDADVHLEIARILLWNKPDWETVHKYEQEALNNTAQAL